MATAPEGVLLASALPVLHARVEGVAEAVAQEVQRQQGYAQGQAGVGHQPPVDANGRDGLKALVGQQAPGDVGRLDPAIYEEDGRVFLLYSAAGEHSIAIAEIFLEEGAR